MRAVAHARVLGPYRESTRGGTERWRVVVVTERRRTSRFAADQAEADALVRSLRKDLSALPPPAAMTVEKSITDYLASRVALDAWLPRSATRARYDLEEFAAVAPARMSQVSADTVRAYIASTARRSMYTRRARYLTVAAWMTWATRHEHCRTDVLAEFDPDELPWRSRRGRAALQDVGKAQLRNADDVHRYLEQARLLRTPSERLLVTLPLLCGLSSGEVLHLRVADVDLMLGVIWVRSARAPKSSTADDQDRYLWSTKTRNRWRTVRIHATNRADLELLTQDRRAESWLLCSRYRPSHPVWYTSLWQLVQAVCRRAGVPEVSPHGLRATWASMVALAAAPSLDVSAIVGAGLGHGRGGKTADRHYIGSPSIAPSLDIPLQPTR